MASAVQEEVIGAAAKDAVRSPQVQAAAYSGAGQAAQNAASQGAAFLKAEWVEVRTFVQENHCSVRLLCFSIAVALLASSVLGLLNIFSAFFRPFQYLFAIYNVIFALAIIVMDGKPEWFRRCGDPRGRLFAGAPMLATMAGRGALYLYVGSVNLCMLPESDFWRVVYLVIGASLCGAGIFMVAHHFCRPRVKPQGDPEYGLDGTSRTRLDGV
mmetsp:Transcript_10151/g.30087  ORF Transcript_10151/g.30087 Transcript_10151/m.30087 type:complete len:213 (-) Transcript_10151:26-664(-)